MAHEMTDHPTRGWRAYTFPLTIVLVWIGVTITLGYIGFGENREFSRSDRLYHSLQLFILHGAEFPENIGWQLQIARFLAPFGEMVGVVLGGIGLSLLWADRMRLALFCFGPRKHTVVCGLGGKGLQLSRGYAQRRRRVIVIEKDRNNSYIPICDRMGAIVLIGDATKVETLREARIHKADSIVACCGDDGANLEIAVRAEEVLAKHFKGNRSAVTERVATYLHIVDLELRTLFQQHKTFEGKWKHLQITIFNVFENGARVLFRNHFLDYGKAISAADDPRQAHLVIVGMGKVGESVLLQAIRLAQFPNEKLLRVTIIDREASVRIDRLRMRYEAIRELCELSYVESHAESPQVVNDIRKWCSDPNSIVTIAVCFDNDAHSLSYGLHLLANLKHQQVPIFVRVGSEAGFSTMLPDAKQSVHRSRIRAFGKIEDACSLAVVIEDSLNRFAQKIHESFAKKRIAEGRSPDDPSIRRWDELDLDLKSSNSQQAEHLQLKLRAINCYTAPPNGKPTISEFSDSTVTEIVGDDVNKLAQMEHRRWCVERALSGWRIARMKDIGEKTHPDLKPWAELSQEVQGYDLEAVKLIPELVALDDRIILRESRMSHDATA